MLSENSKYEFWIPEKNGWYINEYNKIKFCGDDYTWEKIAPLAK